MSKKFSHARIRTQYGAAPYRIGIDGEIELLLITTRETGRWMVPKGWPIKKLGPLGTALREAYEEAGVRGDGRPAIGAFEYLKVMRKGPDQVCMVEVFPILVREELNEWPEMSERERRWFPIVEALAAVQEETLSRILLDLPMRLARVQ